MTLLLQLVYLAAVVVLVVYVLPGLPRWARVGFWAFMSFINILDGDALFAAIFAAVATDEWHKR